MHLTLILFASLLLSSTICFANETLPAIDSSKCRIGLTIDKSYDARLNPASIIMNVFLRKHNFYIGAARTQLKGSLNPDKYTRLHKTNIVYRIGYRFYTKFNPVNRPHLFIGTDFTVLPLRSRKTNFYGYYSNTKDYTDFYFQNNINAGMSVRVSKNIEMILGAGYNVIWPVQAAELFLSVFGGLGVRF